MLIHTAEVATVAYATDYRGRGDGEWTEIGRDAEKETF